MLAHRIAVVMSRVIVEKLYVADQCRAGKDRLEQIVAQKRLFGRSVIERLLESIDVIQAFARVDAFTKKILIDIGCCRCVRINAGIARENARK